MRATGSASVVDSPRTPLWRDPAVARLALVALLGFTSFCLTLSALPVWAARSGASEAAAGSVTAVMLAATVAAQVLVPSLERRWGTTGVLAAGMVLLGAPAPLYLVSGDLGWVLAVSAVRGVGFAVLTVLGATLSVRIAPRGRVGAVVGWYGLGIALPNLLAVPAGAALTLGGWFGWVAVLAAAPLLALPLLPVLGRRGAPEPDQARRPRGQLSASIRVAWPPVLTLLIITATGSGLIAFLPVERPHGMLAPIALAVFGGASALARWRVGALADRYGTRILLPVSVATGAVGLAVVVAGLVTGGSAAYAVLLIGALLFGASYGATQNLTQIVAFARVGAQGTGTASVLWNTAFDGGTGIGAYAVGVSAGLAGLPWTWVGCAALIAMVVPVAMLGGRTSSSGQDSRR